MLREFAHVFPVHGPVFIFHTIDLVRMLREVLQTNKRMLPPDTTVDVKSSLNLNGTITFHASDSFLDDIAKNKFKKFVQMSPKQLMAFAHTIFAKRKNKPEMMTFEFLSTRLYWSLPVSKEYLCQPAVHRAICLIREGVFEMKDTPPIGTFHLGPNWSVIQEAPLPFLQLICNYNKISPVQCRAMFKLPAPPPPPAKENKEEKEDDNIEEKVPSGVQPVKKKRGRPPKNAPNPNKQQKCK